MKSKYGFTRFDTDDEFINWFRNKKVSRKVTRLQIHHTAEPAYKHFYKSNGGHEDELTRQNNMKSYHVNTRKMSDIAQHFTVFPNGKIVTGRSLEKDPSGITGWNSNAICVEIYGNFDKGGDTMTAEQRRAVIMLYGEMCKKFGLTPSTNTIRCHAWFTSGGTYLGGYDPAKSRKSCPGTAFMGFGNTKSAIESNFYPLVKEYISTNKVSETPVQNPSQPTTSQKADPNVKELQTALNKSYSAGLSVDGLCGPKTKAAIKKHYLKANQYRAKSHATWVQSALKKLGYIIDVDGLYGPGSAATVKKFQKDNGLTVDGYAGLDTHLKLISKLGESKESLQNGSTEFIHDFGKCVITNYYTNDELGSGSKGCTGKTLTPNKSCASHNLPCGTKVYIEELKGVVNDDGIFIVEDTGGHCFDFDIFVSKDKSSLVGKRSLDVKVISWGNDKMTSSYTYIINYYLGLDAKDGKNRIGKYHDAWKLYNSMGGKLIDFHKFNDEDKTIKDKDWYTKL